MTSPRTQTCLPTASRFCCALVGLLFGLIGSPTRSDAQGLEPGEIRPALAAPIAPTEIENRLTLPTVPQSIGDGDTLEAGLAVQVDAFAVQGSTVFTNEQLKETLRPWIGRKIESEELLEARDALTKLYLEHGYATSGVVIPDQDVAMGIVQLIAIEGRVAEIEVRGNRRFRDRYFTSRLETAAAAPVRIPSLERALRIMQRDPWIERIDVVLEPGERTGESRLVVAVTEAPQWRLAAEAANDRSPAVGSTGGILEARVANLTGFRDETALRFQGTAGLLDFDARIDVPITRWDTRLRLRARITETELQEEPFESLNIEASARTYGIMLSHPLYRSESDEFWLSFAMDRRQTRSSLLGEAFCFELILTSCQRVVLTALRVGAEWNHRTQNTVIAARTRFSWGIDALGAKTGGGHDAPDGEFFSWLGQLQYAYVLPDTWRSSQILLRADAQLSDDPLLSIEKIAIGGRRTVRGYRENTLVRDNGIMLSGEIRVPVLRDSLRRPIVELVPFMDWGHAKNKGIEPEDDTLWSAGVGTRLHLRHGVLAEAYWGARLKDVQNPKDVLQDYGIHMRLRIEAPDVF